MFDKKAFIGIVAVTLCAQSALGAASVRTVGAQNTGGTTIARAGSMRATSVTAPSATVQSSSVSQGTSVSGADSSRLAAAFAGPGVGIKTNKLVKGTSSTGLALSELERRINELSGEVEENTANIELKLGTDEFSSAFDTRAEEKQLADQPYVRDYVDTTSPDLSGFATKEYATEKATGAERNAAAYTDRAASSAQSTAERNAKSYADTTFATKSNTYTKAEVDAKIPEEVDLSNYYTKSQSDGRYSAAGSSYTKTESDNKYAAQANTYTKSQVYTKEEVDSLTPNVDLTNYYTKEEVEGRIGEIVPPEVDLSNYYNKTQVDTKLGAKLDSQTAASTYETKGTAYSKTETDNKLALKLCGDPTFTVDHPDGATNATVTVKCAGVTKGSFVVPVGAGGSGGEACGLSGLTKTALKEDSSDPTKITGYKLQFKDCNGQPIGEEVVVNNGTDGADGTDAEAPDPCEPVFTTTQITEGTRTGFQITMKNSCKPNATGKTFKLYNGEQGAAGTGIEYQGIVANCTELKTHNGAQKGYAWYKADNGKLYISDGTSTSFNACPDGGVDFQGQPGTDGCSPTLDISDKVSGCYKITLTPFALNSSGVCAPGTAIIRQVCDADPSCAPVAEMVTNRDSASKCKTLKITKKKWNKTAQRCDDDGSAEETPICEPCPATKVVDSAPKTNGCIDRTTTQYTFNSSTQKCDESSTTVERCPLQPVPIPSCVPTAQIVTDRAVSQCKILRIQKTKVNSAGTDCENDGDPTDTPICDPCPAPEVTYSNANSTTGCRTRTTKTYTFNSTTQQCDVNTTTFQECPLPSHKECVAVATMVTNRANSQCSTFRVQQMKLNSAGTDCVEDGDPTDTPICEPCPAPSITYSEPNSTTGCRTRTTKKYTFNSTTQQCDENTTTFQECPIQPLNACAASIAIDNLRAGDGTCKQITIQERTYNTSTKQCEDADTDPQTTTVCDSCPAPTVTVGDVNSSGCRNMTTTSYTYNSSTNQCVSSTTTKTICNGKDAISCAAVVHVQADRGLSTSGQRCVTISTQNRKANAAGTGCENDGEEETETVCDGETPSITTETDSTTGETIIKATVGGETNEIGRIPAPTAGSICPRGYVLQTRTSQNGARAELEMYCAESNNENH